MSVIVNENAQDGETRKFTEAELGRLEDVGVLGLFFGSHLPFRQLFLCEFRMASARRPPTQVGPARGAAHPRTAKPSLARSISATPTPSRKFTGLRAPRSGFTFNRFPGVQALRIRGQRNVAREGREGRKGGRAKTEDWNLPRMARMARRGELSQSIIHFSGSICGLCSRLPSASHTALSDRTSVSAADPVASLWSGGT